MAEKKSFLKPVSALVAALLTATVQSGAQSHPALNTAAEAAKQVMDAEFAGQHVSTNLLTIEPAKRTLISQGHYSHSSHQSHSSHSSHRSHYSGYTS